MRPFVMAHGAHCEMCGERLRPTDALGEFADPAGDDSVIGHAECGLARGLEIA